MAVAVWGRGRERSEKRRSSSPEGVDHSPDLAVVVDVSPFSPIFVQRVPSFLGSSILLILRNFEYGCSFLDVSSDRILSLLLCFSGN